MKNSPQKIYGPITIIYCPNFLGLFNICEGFQFPKKLLYDLFSSEKMELTLFNFFIITSMFSFLFLKDFLLEV